MRTATLKRVRSQLPPALDALTLPTPPAASYSKPIALRRVLKRLRVARGASPLPSLDGSPALACSGSKFLPTEKRIPPKPAATLMPAAATSVTCWQPEVAVAISHSACTNASNAVEVYVSCEPERLFTGAFVIDVGSPSTTDCESEASCCVVPEEKNEVEATSSADFWPSLSLNTSLAGGVFGCFLMLGAWRHAIPDALLGR